MLTKKYLIILSIAIIQIFSSASSASEQIEVDSVSVTESDEVIEFSKITNSLWNEQTIDPSFYDNPYQISLFYEENGEDSERLWSQTQIILGLGFAVAGVVAMMPEDVSGWYPSEETYWEKWSNNVREGPYWDDDNHYINYIGHPYFGGVYYQIARKSGYRQWDAFLYSTLMSTFYWEYGIESFAEIPSVQDLVVTPIGGWLVGEWMLHTEQEILLDDGKVWNSDILGSVSLFFLDPIDSVGKGINNLFNSQIIKAGTGTIAIDKNTLPDGRTENVVQLNFNYEFESDNKAVSSINSKNKLARYSGDPIDTSIIGISTGMGYGHFDRDWQVSDQAYFSAALGLYFSPKFSLTLSYLSGDLEGDLAENSFTWRNYSINGQYYFNTDQSLRPYLALGFGEMTKNNDNDNQIYQTHAGVGLYYKISAKWAVQTDWLVWHSPDENRLENTITSNIIYRFGDGERR